MSATKSLMQWIVESIEEELPGRGKEVYLRGFLRFEKAGYDRQLASCRRELERALSDSPAQSTLPL